MRKMLAAGTLMILATIGLSGCSWFQPQEPVTTTNEPAVIEQPAVTEEPAIVTVADKIAQIDTLGTPYGGVLFSECSDDSKALQTSLDGTAKELILAPDLSVIQTANPDKMTKAEIDKIVDPCAELGSLQVLEASNDSILWSYPHCTGGALPDPELQPALYKDYQDCLVVQKELANLYGLEVEDSGN